jgi:hypothetical protein
MTLCFEPATPADMDEIAAVLVEGFNAEPEGRFVDRNLLRWKYFDSGPDWQGSRSYVLRQKAHIKAHCGVWPLHLSWMSGKATCLSFVDWVSNTDVPGAGVLLKKRLMTLAETSIVVGGSEDTRRLVPRIGFRMVGEVSTFIRVMNPWRQYESRPSTGLLRDLVRLSRNYAWSLMAAKIRIHAGWEVKKVHTFSDDAAVSGATVFPCPARSVDYLNFWLRLPATRVSGYEIRHLDQTVGYFMLSEVYGQTRIIDVRVWPDKPSHWVAAFALATKMAAVTPNTCEILAIASTNFARSALLAAGFRKRGSEPLFLYDPHGKLTLADPIFLNLIDGDGAYLYDASHPYNS